MKLLFPLLWCGYSTSVLALGFGDIDIKSHLGQPLRASVTLLGANNKLDVGCFKLSRSDTGDQSVPMKASIQLTMLGDNTASLTIISTEVVNDPILNFRLSAVCDNLVQRNYVVLLDPPQFGDAITNPTAPSEFLADHGAGKATYNNSTNAPAYKGQHSGHSRKKSHHQYNGSPLSTGENADQAIDASGNAASLNTRQKLSGASNTASKPPSDQAAEARLQITGGKYIPTDFAGMPLNLQLDNALHGTPADAPAPDMSANDMSDEVTAMTNKLSHLESQVTALQKLNKDLMNEKNRYAQLANTTSSSSLLPSWLLYTLIALLILIILGVADWLLRRANQRKLETNHFIWADEAEAGTAANENKEHNEPSEAPADIQTAEVKPVETKGYTAQPEGNGVSVDEAVFNDDILEQAEIFISYGRSNLAIQLLQQYLQESPKESPLPWLLLLEQLKSNGLESDYLRTSADCQKYFNVQLPTTLTANITEDRTIEDYPHIMADLERLWGTPDIKNYLDELIYNRRAKARLGFEQNVYMDIVLLRSIASEIVLGDEAKPALDTTNPAAIGETKIEEETVLGNDSNSIDFKL